ncbi:DNA cytosine methyltransferase [Derxia gummosa]|uniref:DNA (cytosine-5-)-methyltransferase n=1 Tax=Derxia gummosa DSM 723 TaxID=1121388 RepID=A0A8B6X311_9BURK|nr:DNA cytosine methyltransferase [Derxia gummosa]
MLTPQLILGLDDELVIDEFACGGGMSTGIERAIGRHVDMAFNHDPDACSMHEANHPQTRHFCQDVFEADPLLVTEGRPVGLLHLSPDCTHHSQARGGQPRDRQTRALSWVGAKWAGRLARAGRAPRIITLENVRQILQWGPLIAKRCPKTGRVIRLDGTVAAPGERVPLEHQFLVPDPRRAGQTWRRFVAALRGLGYSVEWRVLCAADYGTPTSRERLFMVARCDGAPIVWPEATHHKAPAKGQKRWRSAAEIIDWAIPGKSIFDRPKPLADATLRRVAHGMKKFVLDSASPFIVPITHGGSAGRVHDVHEPLRTVTTAHRGEFAVAAPVLEAACLTTYYGERRASDRRVSGLEEPLPTQTTENRHALTVATLASVFVEQANGGFYEGEGRAADAPLSTITGRGTQQRLVTAHLAHLRGNCDARDVREPLRTISAGGEHHGVVEYHLSPEAEAGALRCAAFLVKYYGTALSIDVCDPLDTITTRDRLALVTVWVRGEPWVVVDIHLRMLTPRELFRAQGFPDSYVIEHGHDGRLFSKSKQVGFCGNSVPPPVGEALIRAQWDSRLAMQRAA